MVIYPIEDNVVGQGMQRIGWVAEIRDPQMRMNDWNARAHGGCAGDFRRLDLRLAGCGAA
jgi:hypothetical protein